MIIMTKRQIDAELYKQLPFDNNLKKKKKIQRHAFGIYFTPLIQESWFYDTDFLIPSRPCSLIKSAIFCCKFALDIFSNGLFQKKSKHGPRVEHMKFPLQGCWRKGTWKSQGPIKKEVEFLEVLKKNLSEISLGLCCWPWN